MSYCCTSHQGVLHQVKFYFGIKCKSKVWHWTYLTTCSHNCTEEHAEPLTNVTSQCYITIWRTCDSGGILHLITARTVSPLFKCLHPPNCHAPSTQDPLLILFPQIWQTSLSEPKETWINCFQQQKVSAINWLCMKYIKHKSHFKLL